MRAHRIVQWVVIGIVTTFAGTIATPALAQFSGKPIGSALDKYDPDLPQGDAARVLKELGIESSGDKSSSSPVSPSGRAPQEAGAPQRITLPNISSNGLNASIMISGRKESKMPDAWCAKAYAAQSKLNERILALPAERMATVGKALMRLEGTENLKAFAESEEKIRGTLHDLQQDIAAVEKFDGTPHTPLTAGYLMLGMLHQRLKQRSEADTAYLRVQEIGRHWDGENARDALMALICRWALNKSSGQDTDASKLRGEIEAFAKRIKASPHDRPTPLALDRVMVPAMTAANLDEALATFVELYAIRSELAKRISGEDSFDYFESVFAYAVFSSNVSNDESSGWKILEPIMDAMDRESLQNTGLYAKLLVWRLSAIGDTLPLEERVAEHQKALRLLKSHQVHSTAATFVPVLARLLIEQGDFDKADRLTEDWLGKYERGELGGDVDVTALVVTRAWVQLHFDDGRSAKRILDEAVDRVTGAHGRQSEKLAPLLAMRALVHCDLRLEQPCLEDLDRLQDIGGKREPLRAALSPKSTRTKKK